MPNMGVMQKMQSIQQNPAEAMSLLNDPDPQVRKVFMKLMGKVMGGAMPNMGGMAGGDEPPDLMADMGSNRTEAPVSQPENKAPTPPKATAAPKASPTSNETTEKWVELKNAGNELYKKRQFEEALEKYDEAFEASGNKELILFSNKAAVYVEMHDLEKAQECVEDALEQRFTIKCSYETAAKLMARMAVICEKKGDLEGCVLWFEKPLVEDNVRKVRGELTKVKMRLAQKKKEDY